MVWNGVPYAVAVLALLLFSIYLGLYWGLFAIAVNRYRLSPAKTLIFLIPAFWVILEFIRAYLFTGFPWLPAGASLWRMPLFLVPAQIAGVYGLSFIVLLINASIALALQRKSLRHVIPGAGVLAAVAIWGMLSIRADYSGEEKINAALLQGSISQYMKWDPAYENYILDTYNDLHSKAAKKAEDIIIWPETSLPGALTSTSRLMNYMKRLSGRSDAWQITGSIERGRDKFYNSAYAINPEGEITGRYRKVHLTPFGEYVPLRSHLEKIVPVLGEYGDFFPGEELKPLQASETLWAVAICYESIFPHLVRKTVKKGGRVFLNITNDGWFLETAGPHQHFAHSVIRSAENRIWTLRAANTGISAIIDPAGKIIKSTSLMEKTVISGTVSLLEKKTFYTIYGDIFVFLVLLALVFNIWRQEKCLENTKQE